MPSGYKVVDLFAGPGGLAEGFSSFAHDGLRPFEVALSVEKEASAFSTLRLRSFFRQFRGHAPEEYYEYVAGSLPKDRLLKLYPEEWEAACEETLQAELGTPAAELEMNRRLDVIKANCNDRAILIGGPPCQAYSLVGRARNKGVVGYVPSADQRHFLYREYIRILDRLNPIAFVMENVKGILSSKIDGNGIFSHVVEDLRNAGGVPNRYTIFSLAPEAQRFVLRAEDHGVPQTRHRVILVGVRSDVPINAGLDYHLPRRNYVPTVADALRGLPPLRSGLSKELDSDQAWRSAIKKAYLSAATASAELGLADVHDELIALARSPRVLARQARFAPAPANNDELSVWVGDERLSVTPNHSTRGHMLPDLARYAFAAVYAGLRGYSPRASDFPSALAPEHKNWKSGKFNDRFRVQKWDQPGTTVTSHISKDGHYFIHPDPSQCRSLTVREAARIQSFPDNYFFEGNRTEQFVQVGNAVPPLLAWAIARVLHQALGLNERNCTLAA